MNGEHVATSQHARLLVLLAEHMPVVGRHLFNDHPTIECACGNPLYTGHLVVLLAGLDQPGTVRDTAWFTTGNKVAAVVADWLREDGWQPPTPPTRDPMAPIQLTADELTSLAETLGHEPSLALVQWVEETIDAHRDEAVVMASLPPYGDLP